MNNIPENLIIDLRPNISQAEAEPRKTFAGKLIKGTVEWAIYGVLFVVIVWGTPLMLTKVLKTDYPIAAITSSSMWPNLKKGDIVLIQGVSAKEDVVVGDIVVYENIKGFTIHRIVEMDKTSLVTKGDANNIEDKPVGYDKLVGKALNIGEKPFRIPWLGKLSTMFKINAKANNPN